MVDKTNPKDDEYQFSDLETNDIYTTSMNSEAVARFRKLRRLLFISAVLIILFAVYKLSGVFTGKPKQVPPAITAKVQAANNKTKMAVETPASTAVPTITTTTASTSPAPTVQSTVSYDKNSLTDLAQSNANTQTELKKLAAEMETISESISSLQSSLENLNNSVQTLVSQSQQQTSILENQVTLLKNLQPPPKPSIKVAKKKVNRQAYYIDAMVPGRAWLKDNEGTTWTVSVGDKLQGYEGVITTIDANAGEVILSSGEVVRYRSDDR